LSPYTKGPLLFLRSAISQVGRLAGRDPNLKAYDLKDKETPTISYYSNERALHNLSLVVLVPIGPRIGRKYIRSVSNLVQRAAALFRGCRLVFDPRGAAPPRDSPHPGRQPALAKIRQDMVDRHLGNADWVVWVDADIVGFPKDLFSQLILRADGGIAAPVVLMDGAPGAGPENSDWFGPGKFYDVAGFVERMRWARFSEPWFDQPGPTYSLDSVGSCYIVSSEIYRRGARHAPDQFSLDFVKRGLKWTNKSVTSNQRGPANCFTEHFSVCQWAKQHAYPVRAYGDLVAWHAKV